VLARRLAALCAFAALALAGAAAGSIAHAEAAGTAAFKVVVNAANPSSSVSRDFLAAAFLKKATRWDDGTLIRPVDLFADSAVRRAFSSGVLERPVAAVRNYWQQRIFSGSDIPPPELDSDEAVVRYVAAYPGAVGYVSPGANLGGTKVLAVR
jgi:ABC-type phosphate transport system substrate-binding protein